MLLDSKIKTFMTLAEGSGIADAASSLGISQDKIIRHVRDLEEHYSQKLFSLNESGLCCLTSAGRLLLKRMNSISNDLKHTKDELRCFGNCKCEIKLGVTHTIGQSVIPRPLARYLLEPESFDVSMEVASTEKLTKKLLNGKLNIAMTESGFDTDIFDAMLYATVPFVAVCSTRHKFKLAPVYLKDLTRECLLIREQSSSTRHMTERCLWSKGIAPTDFERVVEVASVQAILQMIDEDLGFSFMYAPCAEEAIRQGRLKEIPLKDLSVYRDFHFIWPRSSSYHDEYIQMCKRICEIYQRMVNPM